MSIRSLFVVLALGAAAVAHTQTPIGPFASPTQEKFDALPPGSHPSFAGFGGLATFSRIGTGLLIVNVNTTILPFISPKSDLFGRGADVRIKFKKIMTQFGGQFRVAKAGVVVTTATFKFYRGGAMVGVAVVAPISLAAWKWHGYDLSKFNGFDEVRIFGNGKPVGYVGMENLVVK